MMKNTGMGKKAKKPSAAAIAAVLAAVLYIIGYNIYNIPGDGCVEIHFIDVGQGDSALILTEDGAALIDAGTAEAGDKVAAYVKSRTDFLDYMILSHPHEDHIGGAPAVFDAVVVENVVMPDRTADTSSFDRLLDSVEESGAEVIPAERGRVFSLGGAELSILSPTDGNEYDNTNDISAVVRMVYGDVSFLFTGDAEAEVEKALLETGDDLRCSVLKVGHHGSSSSSTEEFVKAVSPDIAVISCGRDNSYGHPHHEVVKLLEKYGADIYRTDRLGDIIITSDGRSVLTKKLT